MAEVREPSAVQSRWRTPARVAAPVTVLVYAWWVTSFRAFTWPIRIATAVPGVLLLVLRSATGACGCRCAPGSPPGA
jgi:hypothetical protein